MSPSSYNHVQKLFYNASKLWLDFFRASLNSHFLPCASHATTMSHRKYEGMEKNEKKLTQQYYSSPSR